MAQINQYPNEVNALNPLIDEDFFDVDKFTNQDPPAGPFESQKVSYGYLVTQLSAAIGGGTNLGNSDLTQTDQQRTYDGGGSRFLLWNELRRFFIELSDWGDDTQASFRVNQLGTPGINRTFAEFRKGNVRRFRIFENGRVEAINGGFAAGDGTIPLAFDANHESNPGLLALFASSQRPTVFTDVVFPETPTSFEPQNSALTWFRSISKGVLFPSMSTTQRDAIITPEPGLVIFNNSLGKMQVYNGVGVSGWQNMN